jgi:hypothetical protein
LPDGCGLRCNSFRFEALNGRDLSGGHALSCSVIQTSIACDEKLKRATANTAKQFVGRQD